MRFYRVGLVACACVSDRKRATRVRVWHDSATVAPGALSKPEQCAAWLVPVDIRTLRHVATLVPLAEIAPREKFCKYTRTGSPFGVLYRVLNEKHIADANRLGAELPHSSLPEDNTAV